eukprot:SAG11_NODE_1285_length_5300_cov_1.629494_8_plen_71_part_00
MNLATAVVATNRQLAEEQLRSTKDSAADHVLHDIERVLECRPRLPWLTTDLDELFATLGAARGTLQVFDT